MASVGQEGDRCRHCSRSSGPSGLRNRSLRTQGNAVAESLTSERNPRRMSSPGLIGRTIRKAHGPTPEPLSRACSATSRNARGFVVPNLDHVLDLHVDMKV